MKATAITSCYIGPNLSPEQFISEHFFLFLAAGAMTVFDGSREFQIAAGDCGIARRNHLAKYSKQPENGQFEKVVVVFDQPFLKKFNGQHSFPVEKAATDGGIIGLEKSLLVENFVQSLSVYFNENGAIDPAFFEIKRSELLLILLKGQPGLANVFFDFGSPEKVDIRAFMNKNYRFNVSVERFAYLTGRSLSAFKREFETVFNETPSRWLVQKRLHEAHFLLEKTAKKPSDIYVELGFEDLSHFSFAFKKRFGVAPTELGGRKVGDGF